MKTKNPSRARAQHKTARPFIRSGRTSRPGRMGDAVPAPAPGLARAQTPSFNSAPAEPAATAPTPSPATPLNGSRNARPDLLGELSGFCIQVVELATRPAPSAPKELARPHGWRSGLLNLVPTFILAALIMALAIYLDPAVVQIAQEAGVPEALVWLAASLLLALLYTLAALVSTLMAHTLALLAGGQGDAKSAWQLITKLMVVFNPLWMLAGLLVANLPGLDVGTAHYGLARMLVDIYFVWVLAQILPAAYKLSKNRAIGIAVLLWLLGVGFELAVGLLA